MFPLITQTAHRASISGTPQVWHRGSNVPKKKSGGAICEKAYTQGGHEFA